MWCSHCGKSVSHDLSSAINACWKCPRCQAVLHDDVPWLRLDSSHDTDLPAIEIVNSDAKTRDTEMLSNNVADATGQLHVTPNQTPDLTTTKTTTPTTLNQLDSDGDRHFSDPESSTPAAQTEARGRNTWVVWLLFFVSVGLFACGAALIGWSLVEDSDLLWDTGVPIALTGQAGFFIAVLLQLDVIGWHAKQIDRNVESFVRSRQQERVDTSTVHNRPRTNKAVSASH